MASFIRTKLDEEHINLAVMKPCTGHEGSTEPFRWGEVPYMRVNHAALGPAFLGWIFSLVQALLEFVIVGPKSTRRFKQITAS